jgi:hypothetical protein
MPYRTTPNGAQVSQANDFTRAQLELFSIRGAELAERVAVGQIKFLDAIDLLYDAATSSGLIENAGDEAVQAIMACAFAGAGERVSRREVRR